MFKIKNVIFILTAGILWGIISIFVNVLSELGFTSMQIVAVRVFFSAAILLIYLLICDKKALKIRFKDIPFFLGTGVFSIIFFNFCYFQAIRLMGGSAIPALLLYTAPIFVMIISCILFKEKITKQKILALLLTLIGLTLVTGALTGGGELSLVSVLFGIGAGFGYALYSIFGKFLVGKYSAVTITAYTFIVASLFAVPFSGVAENIELLFSLKGISAALILAFFCTVLPFLLYTKGLEGAEAGKASVLAAIEPFMAAVIGVIFWDEVMTAAKICGMIFILAAIVILNLKKKS